jgi:hypothetical protein
VGTQKVGDTVTVKLDLGARTITGGPMNILTITGIVFDLSCRVPPPPAPGCTSEGPVMAYAGAASITSNCPTTWTSNSPAGGPSPAQVIFTATPAIIIPHDTPDPPGTCFLQCNLTVLAPSTNTSGFIEEAVTYSAAQCDNGELDSGGFQTGEVPVVTATDYDCYEVPRGRIPPHAVTLLDRFGMPLTTIRNLHRLCAPADKNGDNPAAPSDPVHLAAYDIGTPTGTFATPHLMLATQFGILQADLGPQVRLDVPTAKSLVAPPPPALVNPGVPNFQCYGLRNIKNAPATKGVHVVDQLLVPFGGLTLDIDKRGPFSLCVPMTINGDDPAGPTESTFLVCNHTKNDTLPFNQKTVFITNIFQSSKGVITQYDELCVPANLL